VLDHVYIQLKQFEFRNLASSWDIQISSIFTVLKTAILDFPLPFGSDVELGQHDDSPRFAGHSHVSSVTWSVIRRADEFNVSRWSLLSWSIAAYWLQSHFTTTSRLSRIRTSLVTSSAHWYWTGSKQAAYSMPCWLVLSTSSCTHINNTTIKLVVLK